MELGELLRRVDENVHGEARLRFAHEIHRTLHERLCRAPDDDEIDVGGAAHSRHRVPGKGAEENDLLRGLVDDERQDPLELVMKSVSSVRVGSQGKSHVLTIS